MNVRNLSDLAFITIAYMDELGCHKELFLGDDGNLYDKICYAGVFDKLYAIMACNLAKNIFENKCKGMQIEKIETTTIDDKFIF